MDAFIYVCISVSTAVMEGRVFVVVRKTVQNISTDLNNPDYFGNIQRELDGRVSFCCCCFVYVYVCVCLCYRCSEMEYVLR